MGWNSLEREIRSYPDVTDYLDPNHSPLMNEMRPTIKRLDKRLSLGIFAILVLIGVVALATPINFPWGAKGPSYQQIFSTIRMSASREKVLAALGHPAISTSPNYSDVVLRNTLPLDAGGGSDDVPEENWEFIEQDQEAFISAARSLDFRADLYEFPDIIVEVDYLEDVVVQYSIMLRTRKQFDLLSVTDLGWLQWNDQQVPHTIGGTFFSQYVPLWCTLVEAISGSRDGWASLGCYPSKFTNELGVQFAYQERGANFPNPADKLNWPERDDLGRPIGMGLMTLSPPSSVNCTEYGTDPIVSQEVLDRTLGRFNEETGLEALLCSSLRVTQPNGIILTDYNRQYDSLTLPSGMQIQLDPKTLSQGLISFSTFGFRRDAFFLASEYITAD